MLKQYPAALLKQKALSRTSSGLVFIARHTTRKRGRDPGGQIVAKLYATCRTNSFSHSRDAVIDHQDVEGALRNNLNSYGSPATRQGGVAKSIVLHNRATTRV